MRNIISWFRWATYKQILLYWHGPFHGYNPAPTPPLVHLAERSTANHVVELDVWYQDVELVRQVSPQLENIYLLYNTTRQSSHEWAYQIMIADLISLELKSDAPLIGEWI